MESGKQNGILTGLLCFLSLLVSVITLSVCLSFRTYLSTMGETTVRESILQTSESVSTETPKPLFTIKLVDGSITVLNASGETVKALEKNPAFLPEKERAVLEEGIEVFSSEEYYLVIENYME